MFTPGNTLAMILKKLNKFLYIECPFLDKGLIEETKKSTFEHDNYAFYSIFQCSKSTHNLQMQMLRGGETIISPYFLIATALCISY